MCIFTSRNPKRLPGWTRACFQQGTNNDVQYLFFQATIRKYFTSHISSDILQLRSLAEMQETGEKFNLQ